jgi:hypothetical protein
MSSAWIFQKMEQIEKLGAEAASWYVGWYEPNGRRKKKSCGPGGQGKKNAQRLARKIVRPADHAGQVGQAGRGGAGVLNTSMVPPWTLGPFTKVGTSP